MTHIHFAYSLEKDQPGTTLTGSDIAEKLEKDELAWVHLDATHPDTRPWLAEALPYLDPFIREALVAEETRPRTTVISDGVLVILRGVNVNENEDPEDMVSVRLWIDPSRIISLERRQVRAIRDIEIQLQKRKGPTQSGDFICRLISILTGRMEPLVQRLDDDTDHLEEQVLEEASASLREAIVDVRRQAILFRRHMAPQRDAVGNLRGANVSWLDETQRRQLFESYNLVIRYVEDLDAIRERAQIVKDELANILADRLNKNMYMLSVIAAIFLPLGFLTGLFGINVGGIPGSETGSAFAMFCVILTVIVFIQVALFKALKWF